MGDSSSSDCYQPLRTRIRQWAYVKKFQKASCCILIWSNWVLVVIVLCQHRARHSTIIAMCPKNCHASAQSLTQSFLSWVSFHDGQC